MERPIWEADLHRQRKWDEWVRQRPRCADCGRPIVEDRCLQLEEDSFLCLDCMRSRVVDTP